MEYGVHQKNDSEKQMPLKRWKDKKIEGIVDKISMFCEPRYAKKILKTWHLRLSAFMKLILHIADTFSDITIVYVVWKRFLHHVQLFAHL